MIQWGETVVIKLHDETSSYVIQAKDIQKVARRKVNLNQIVGAPHGSVFEAGPNQTMTFVSASDYNEENVNMDLYVPDTERGDNRNYVDSNTSQKLSTKDIDDMRKEGVSGTEIIQKLISNSETWNKKTIFAQEKWLKKKQQKYACKMRIQKATPSTICDVYNTKSKDKISGLRNDTLAQIIGQSGIHAGSKVLVFESMLGMIVGTVAYHLRSYGQILCLYEGQQPHFHIIRSLNLDSASEAIIHPVPSKELAAAADYVMQYGLGSEMYQTFIENEEIVSKTLSVAAVAIPAPVIDSSMTIDHAISQDNIIELEQGTSNNESSDNGNGSGSNSSINLIKNENNHNSELSKNNTNETKTKEPVIHIHRSFARSARSGSDLVTVRRLLREGSNSLIIACHHHPLPILRECLPLLGPSSPFVVYCEFIEPLVECYQYVMNRGDCLRLRLCDTWLREFQTLPGRVHPQMYMSSTGGYLLLGIYVGIITPTPTPTTETETETPIVVNENI